jgi:hypothetical protein
LRMSPLLRSNLSGSFPISVNLYGIFIPFYSGPPDDPPCYGDLPTPASFCYKFSEGFHRPGPLITPLHLPPPP